MSTYFSMRQGQPKSEPKLYDGYGHEYDDLESLKEEILNYRDFDTAAAMIDPLWTRHNLHKWVAEGKVCRSEILVLTDDALYANIYSGKKMFIHINEIDKIKLEYEAKPKSNYKYCDWCGRKLQKCITNECPERYNSNPANVLKDAEISQLVAGAIQRLDKRKRTGVFREIPIKRSYTE